VLDRPLTQNQILGRCSDWKRLILSSSVGRREDNADGRRSAADATSSSREKPSRRSAARFQCGRCRSFKATRVLGESNEGREAPASPQQREARWVRELVRRRTRSQCSSVALQFPELGPTIWIRTPRIRALDRPDGSSRREASAP